MAKFGHVDPESVPDEEAEVSTTTTDLVLTLADAGDGYRAIRIGDPGDPDEHYLLFWPGSGGTANRERWIELVRVYGTHGALEALEEGRTNGVDPLPPLGDDTSAATSPPATTSTATPSTPAPTGSSSGSLPGGGSTMSGPMSAAEILANARGKVATTSPEGLMDQAKAYHVAFKAAGNDEERQAVLDSVPDELKPFLPQHFAPDGTSTWSGSGGTTPPATNGTAPVAATVAPPVGSYTGVEYCLAPGAGNMFAILKWDAAAQAWVTTGQHIPDEAEVKAALKKNTVDEVAKAKLEGKNKGFMAKVKSGLRN